MFKKALLTEKRKFNLTKLSSLVLVPTLLAIGNVSINAEVSRCGQGMDSVWVISDTANIESGRIMDFSVALDAKTNRGERTSTFYIGWQGSAYEENGSNIFHSKLVGKTTVPKRTATRILGNLSLEYFKGNDVVLKQIAGWADTSLTLNSTEYFEDCLDGEPDDINTVIYTEMPDVTMGLEFVNATLDWENESNNPELDDNDKEFLIPDAGFIVESAEGLIFQDLSNFLSDHIDPELYEDQPVLIQEMIESLLNPDNVSNEVNTIVEIINDYEQRKTLYLAPNEDGIKPLSSAVPAEGYEEAYIYYIYINVTRSTFPRTIEGTIVLAATGNFDIVDIVELSTGRIYPPTW